MHPDTVKIAGHMRDFGCHLAGKAINQALYQYDDENFRYGQAIAITLIAHATEILIKSHIAQKDVLLIFDILPKTIDQNSLSIADLLEDGRTLKYSDLPKKLEEETGYNLKDQDAFCQFGRLRNQIVHFAVPDEENLQDRAIVFAFGFLDRLLEDLWQETLFSYIELSGQNSSTLWAESGLQNDLDRLKIGLTETSQAYLKEKEGVPWE